VNWERNGNEMRVYRYIDLQWDFLVFLWIERGLKVAAEVSRVVRDRLIGSYGSGR
jgi:hypothetical protein